VQNGPLYTITGTGLPGSTITIGGVSVPVLVNGTFTVNAPLLPGRNIITQRLANGTILTNSIYINGSPIQSTPSVVTSIVDNGDGTYTISGTGQPGEVITIAGITTTISP